VAHLLGPAHVNPDAAAILELVALTLVQPRRPFKTIEGRQSLWAHGIDLAAQPGFGVIAGSDRHRKWSQVIQLQPRNRPGANEVSPC